MMQMRKIFQIHSESYQHGQIPRWVRVKLRAWIVIAGRDPLWVFIKLYGGGGGGYHYCILNREPIIVCHGNHEPSLGNK